MNGVDPRGRRWERFHLAVRDPDFRHEVGQYPHFRERAGNGVKRFLLEDRFRVLVTRVRSEGAQRESKEKPERPAHRDE